MKKLQWNQPTKKTLASGTVRRVWRSSCGSYRVEELRHAGLPTVYLAIFADWGAELLGGRDRVGLIIGRRGGRRAAEADCRRHRAAAARAQRERQRQAQQQRNER